MKKRVIVVLCFTLIGYSIHPTPPLLEKYPTLQPQLHHISLGNYPTPIIHADALAQKLGIKKLYIKDDGVNGFTVDGIRHPGGNKNRKLEFLLGDALAQGFTKVSTIGSAGSNHACETAHCAQQLGLHSILFLNDQRPTSYTVRNLKLDVSFGADIYYSTEDDDALGEQVQKLCDENHYYYVPMGGSNALGALGYVNAMFELRQQIDAGQMPEPDVLYVTLGSAGTAAGVIIGAQRANFRCAIIPVRVSYTPEFKTNLLLTLIKQTEEFLHALYPQFTYNQISPELISIEQQTDYLKSEYNVFITHDVAGDGYAATTPLSAQAIDLIDQHVGIKLDVTYTGKTAAAFVRDAQDGKHRDNIVLFWNTFSHGTFEALTDHVSGEESINKLPAELHHYLTDELQLLDRGV